MNSDFNILINKINAFKKKYVLFQILRGILVVFLLFIFIYFIFNAIEYEFFLPSLWRRIFFLTTVLFLGLVSLRYIVYPFLQLIEFINILNKKRISGIIQKLIPEIKDKLLNVVELNELSENNYSVEIIDAAISQKINDLKIINFSDSISLKNLKTLFLYLIFSFVIIISVYIADKSAIIETGNRIIHFNQEFTKPSPFFYELINNSLFVKKGNDFTVKVKCNGDDLPSVIYINIGGNNFIMNRTKEELFEFDINSVTNSIEFYFTDLKYNSPKYQLNVIPVAVINGFEIEVNPPFYTGLAKQTYDNIGDIKISKGSLVHWIFECFDTDSLQIVLKDGMILKSKKTSLKKFEIDHSFILSDYYDIQIKNKRTEYETAMNFTVNVTDDLFPEIKIVQIPDSVQFTKFYFKGTIHDDYGFSSLQFHINSDQKDTALKLTFIPYLRPQDFYYTVDFQNLSSPGKILNYYFSVTDNDMINGPKTTTSESFVFKFPDRTEMNAKTKEGFENVEKLLKESREIAGELKSDLKDIQLKNMDNSISEWDKSQMIEEIVNKKENLENILDKIEKLNQNNSNYQNTFNKKSEEILKKQEEFQKLLDNVMTDEIKKLLEEFSKLAEEFNSKQLNELSKKMDLSFEDLEKQLDRNLEMLKRMKIEQDFKDIIEKVKEVQKNEETGAKEINENKDFDNQKNKVNEDLSEINNIQKKLSEIMNMNDQLEKPLIIDNFRDEFEEIKNGMNKSMEELENKNRKNSSGSMNKTAEKLKSVAFAMEQMLKSNNMEQNMENIRNLEQILKNLIYLSFNQEDILKNIASTISNDPELRNLTRKQRSLIDESQIVKDSLYALAKRAPQIGNMVNNELLTMEINFSRAAELMGEGLFPAATTNQQIVLTSVNNLALYLSDVLKNMREQQENSEEANGNCKKPGNGKNSIGGLKSKSENLRNQLQQMIEQMKNGEKNMSRQLGQSLMEHEMMQQMLRELMNNGSVGNSARKQMQEIDQLLEQNKKEIVNKRINSSLIQRHNEILTRLLEAEKSEMERDQDKKRESNTADEKFYSNPAKIFELDKKKNITIENFMNGTLKLNNFYQDKYKNYVEKFNGKAKE